MQDRHIYDHVRCVPVLGVNHDIHFGTVLNAPTNGYQSCNGKSFSVPVEGELCMAVIKI